MKILEPLQDLLSVVGDGALVLLEASCCSSVTFYSLSGSGPDSTGSVDTNPGWKNVRGTLRFKKNLGNFIFCRTDVFSGGGLEASSHVWNLEVLHTGTRNNTCYLHSIEILDE